jgi:MFS family permease
LLPDSNEGQKLSVALDLGNVVGNLFIAWWFIWYIGRRFAFTLGTIVLLFGVALQAGARNFSMIIVGRIIAGIGTAMYAPSLAMPDFAL